MAYIIKSNATLRNPENAVGNIFGYYGADDYKGMLDFSNNIYLVNGVKKSINEVIDVSRANASSVTNIFGEYTEVSSNTPRISYSNSLNVAGLITESRNTNFATGSDNGSSFTITDAVEDIYLSWYGTGNVVLNTTGLTLRTEFSSGNRTHKFYARSGGKIGTITVTGEVSNIVIANSNNIRSFTPYNQIAFADEVRLVGALRDMLRSGTGTIICRYALLPDSNRGFRNSFYLSAKNADKAGGVHLIVDDGTIGINTAEVKTNSDNTIAGVQQAHILGSNAKVAVAGLMFKNNGAESGLLAYNQAGFGKLSDNSGVAPTTLTEFFLGLTKGTDKGNTTTNAIITHCVVYDRVLSEAEATKAATFGL